MTAGVRRTPVSKERLAQTDHYRAQINADQKLVAFCYNALADFYTREGVSLIRNELADAVDEVIRRHFRVAQTRQEFRAFLHRWLVANVVDDGSRERAQALWSELDTVRS